jgi:hypothetical protein
MPFELPYEQRDALKSFLNFPPDSLRKLLDALKEAKPTLGLQRLARKIASKADLGVKETVELLQLFVGLYAARSAADVPAEEFIEDIYKSTQGLNDQELQPAGGNWDEFKSSLREVLEMRDSLGITSKALGVMLEHERVFLGSKVVSDFRPIFRDSTTDPAAGVIIHNLKIVYRDSKRRAFFVALDNSDLESLKRTIERAMDKAESIKSLVEQTKLVYLDPNF